MNTFSYTLGRTLEGQHLTPGEAADAMREVLRLSISAPRLGAWLAALATKGETAGEISGFVQALREQMVPVHISGPVIDVVGTGGDHSGSFNASTAAALIASAAGATVAKSGNRAASSQCGSADLLEALGVQIELDPTEAAEWIDEVGFAFLFTPQYHPALRSLAPLRRELGFRTVFNLLGPLGNPARPRGQVVGVARRNLAPLYAEVLSDLGVKRALVIHSLDGLDEFSLSAPTEVFELDRGTIRHYQVEPTDVGLQPAPAQAQKGGSPAENADRLRRLAAGEHGPIRDFSLFNAAAALVVAELAQDLREGVHLGAAALDGGAVGDKIQALITRSQTRSKELGPA